MQFVCLFKSLKKNCLKIFIVKTGLVKDETTKKLLFLDCSGRILPISFSSSKKQTLTILHGPANPQRCLGPLNPFPRELALLLATA